MGIIIHHHFSLYSFMMGIMWFNVFVILGLIIRKMKYPIRYSVAPLLLLLVLSILRTFVSIHVPRGIVVFSETIYPAVVNFMRYEFTSLRVFDLPINVVNLFIFVWIIVTVCLLTRYFYNYIVRFNPIINWLGSHTRDEYAESVLANEIGFDKNFRVYRSKSLSTAVATAIKRYIILPDIEFSQNELRVILLHEWKHIRDKDYLTEIIINVICFIFWWNPVVYILKKNFHFAKELKCDQYAISNKNDFHSFLEGLLLLDAEEKKNNKKRLQYEGFDALIDSGDALKDRLNILALKGELRSKRVISNICYTIVLVALFVGSYMFVVVPVFWESPYTDAVTPYLYEYTEDGGVLRADENFILDNSDGTFSLYIDGQFMMYIDETYELFNWLTIRTRDEN